MRRLPCLVLLALLSSPVLAFPDSAVATIERIVGVKGTVTPEESVFKISSPRDDVVVEVDRWPMPPFMGLTSWVAFQEGKAGQLMVMGDLVLFPDEVNPVMSAVLAEGLQVTALHNHFFYDHPRVFFMHIGGEGDAESLARGVKATFVAVEQVRRANAEPASGFGPPLQGRNSISPSPLEAILAVKPAVKDGMVKFVIGRKATMPCECVVGKDMGVNTWAAFAGSDLDAIVDGDFVVQEDELQDVLKTLRSEGVNVVAIHQHMLGESPRYIFLHYWGRGAASALASSLAKALRHARD